MSQVQIKLTGAKAVVAILLVTAFMGYRFFSECPPSKSPQQKY